MLIFLKFISFSNGFGFLKTKLHNKSRHFLRKDTKKNYSGMDIRDDDTEKIDPYYSIKTEYVCSPFRKTAQ
jgi:hypothetical protein